MSKREVHLQPAERDRLVKLVSQGFHHSNEIKRAYILLHSDGEHTDEAIGKMVFCSEDTVRRTRIR